MKTTIEYMEDTIFNRRGMTTWGITAIISISVAILTLFVIVKTSSRPASPQVSTITVSEQVLSYGERGANIYRLQRYMTEDDVKQIMGLPDGNQWLTGGRYLVYTYKFEKKEVIGLYNLGIVFQPSGDYNRAIGATSNPLPAVLDSQTGIVGFEQLF